MHASLSHYRDNLLLTLCCFSESVWINRITLQFKLFCAKCLIIIWLSCCWISKTLLPIYDFSLLFARQKFHAGLSASRYMTTIIRMKKQLSKFSIHQYIVVSNVRKRKNRSQSAPFPHNCGHYDISEHLCGKMNRKKILLTHRYVRDKNR